MGCDIHCYLEYYSEESKPNVPYVHSFSYDQIAFGRDYLLFGCLAGVRHAIKPIVEPRGLADDPEFGWVVKNKLFLKIIDEEPNSTEYNCISRTEAERLLSSTQNKYTTKKMQNDGVIVNPDYHTISWVSLSELLKIRKLYLLENVKYWSDLSGKKRKELTDFIDNTSESDLFNYTFGENDSAVLYSTILCMTGFERMSTYTKTRLVFWFDN